MKFIYYCVFILLISSCNDTTTTATKVVDKPEASRVKKHNQVSKIQSKFEMDIDSWIEYENLAIFLQQYTAISPNDALNNSRELNDITKSIIDSVQPQFLVTAAFKARLNLLYNETLRLYDMSSIPAIKATEVNHQVANILNAFSSVNFKINTILTQSELEKNITEPDFKRNIPENLNINSSNTYKTPIKKNLSIRKVEKGRKKEFFKKSKQNLMLEKEYLQEKKNKQQKLFKSKKKKNN
ncbi:hypothetical protein N9W38_02745 [Flavobacteriaceae bacterium]|nr:hypothetical protein [Flavobacteriaceae bacterium]